MKIKYLDKDLLNIYNVLSTIVKEFVRLSLSNGANAKNIDLEVNVFKI